MKDYVILTDSACDMELSTLKEWNVKCVDLTLKFEGEDKVWANSDVEPKDFYQKMRDGGVAKTSAVNTEIFKQAFEEEIKKGNDVIYIAFSSSIIIFFLNLRYFINLFLFNYFLLKVFH